jgi:hypothetical protein
MNYRPFIVALVAVIIAGPAVQGRESNMVAGNIRAVKVDGTAWQVIDGRGQRERLGEGDFLRQGNTVETASDGRVVLLFENGSTIQLQPKTKFSVEAFMVDPFDAEKTDFRRITAEPTRSVTKIGVKEGVITAKILKLQRSSSYDIGTPLGTAGIRGTVVTVSVSPNAAKFVVTKGMIQVTKDGQTFWISEGDSQQADGDSRTGREGTQGEETVIIATEESYTPPPGEVASLSQQGQQFSETANQSIPAQPFSGAPQQQSGSTGDAAATGSTDGSDSGGDSGGGAGSPGGAPALPGGFGGGGGGGGSGGSGGSSGGGGIYSN